MLRRPGNSTRGTRRPAILLVGSPDDTDGLARWLRRHLVVVLHRAADPADAVERIHEQTRAIVLTTPLPGWSAPRAVGYLCRQPHSTGRPLLVWTHRAPGRAQEARLYRLGADGIYVRDEDRRALLHRLIQLPDVPVRLPTHPQDRATAHAVRRALRAAAGLHATRIAARVEAGTVYLSGVVDALWKKALAERLAGEADGVRYVVGRALEVRPPAIDDATIARSVRIVLEATTALDAATIDVDVDDGCVRVAGTVDNRDELLRLVDLLAHVRGVREIVNLTTVSASSRRDDGARARRFRRALRSPAGDEQLSLSVFGQVVVARGTVPSPARRNAVVGWLERQAGVARVVDKLRVERPPPAA